LRAARPLGVILLAAALPLRAAGDSVDVLVLRTEALKPYEAARKALEEALPESHTLQSILVDPKSAGSAETRIRALSPRVIVTLGSNATSWALDHTEATPIVFATVLSPVESGFVRSFDRPGGRVTGAALDIPAATYLRTLREVLGARRVGVLYNPSQSGDIVEAARREARSAGMDLVAMEVSELGALDAALEQLRGSVDALWSIPDPSIYTRAGAERILLYTLQKKVPFMGLSEHYVRAGALLALATSYEENGRQAAERVRRILAGEPPERIPVSRPQSIEVVFNPETEHRIARDLSRPKGLGFRSLD
jgi:putative ABC transport system substrate-binding protein